MNKDVYKRQGLEVVNIPPQVVIIDDGAFYGCRSLKAINLPNTVVGIGSMAVSYTHLWDYLLRKRTNFCRRFHRKRINCKQVWKNCVWTV